MRGLKQTGLATDYGGYSRIFYRCVDWNTPLSASPLLSKVASFTDAWIETMSRQRICFCGKKSHLLQMRGLKHFYWFRVRASIGRIFYRCVDWNKVLLMRRLLPRVASFTDAWIETYFRRREQYLKSRIFYRCVDWNCDEESIVMGIMCRIFYRCVDWNKAS